MTLLAGENKLPDVFWLEQATAKEFAQNGYLYDLTDALDHMVSMTAFFPDWCIHVPLT